MSTPEASPSQQGRRLQVFLCHASGDKAVVRDLYRRMKADGFAPWLDEEELLPGQHWQEEIPAAVRACDIVVVCLSQKSISKEGYLQKEIRVALSVAEEKPEGTIFIIPARLEPVDLPKRLGQWQWANLFQEDGYQRLVRALNLRAVAIGITMAAPVSTATPDAPVAQADPKPLAASATVKVEQEKSAANKISESRLAHEAVVKQHPVAAVGKRPDRFGWNQKKYWYLGVVIMLVTVAVLIQIGPRKGESPRETNSLSAKAMNQIGDKFYKTEEYQQARQWYELAAADGNTEAMWNLGVLYEFGKGVAKDYQQARQWYEKAAAAGYAAAMNRLGVLYAYGRGVTQDNRQARKWFEKAAAAGDPDAELRLRQLPN